jgi:zinc and cadmium transporter
MRWPAALVGLTLHSVLDGLALAASLEADRAADTHGAFAGFGVLLVVLLHKPFDSLTLATLLAIEHTRPATAWLINVLYAFSLPIGAVAFYFGVQHASDSSYLLGAALAFAGGTFLCISTSDLLPELQFHSHDKAKLTAALLAGLAVAALIVGLEERTHNHRVPEHMHEAHQAAS